MRRASRVNIIFRKSIKSCLVFSRHREKRGARPSEPARHASALQRHACDCLAQIDGVAARLVGENGILLLRSSENIPSTRILKDRPSDESAP